MRIFRIDISAPVLPSSSLTKPSTSAMTCWESSLQTESSRAPRWEWSSLTNIFLWDSSCQGDVSLTTWDSRSADGAPALANCLSQANILSSLPGTDVCGVSRQSRTYSTSMSSARSVSGGLPGDPWPRTQCRTQWARSRVTELGSFLNDEITVSRRNVTVLPSQNGLPSPGSTAVLSESTALERKRMSRHSLLAAADTISVAASPGSIRPASVVPAPVLAGFLRPALEDGPDHLRVVVAQLPELVVELARRESERAVGADVGCPVQHNLVGLHEPDVGLRVVGVGGDHVHRVLLAPLLEHDHRAVLGPGPVVEVHVGVPDLHRSRVPS